MWVYEGTSEQYLSKEKEGEERAEDATRTFLEGKQTRTLKEKQMKGRRRKGPEGQAEPREERQALQRRRLRK